MNILILGDIVGPSGREALIRKLPNLIKKKELQKKFNIKIDYLEIRNEKNLTSLIKNKKIRLFVAYYINKVRLIDNF